MPHRCPDKEQYWRDIIARFGLWRGAVREFCQWHGLVETAFYFWRRELVRRDAASTKIAGHGPRGQAIHFSNTEPVFQSVSVRPGPLDVNDDCDGQVDGPIAACSGRGADAGAPSGAAIDLRLPGGRVLRIRPGFDASTLQRLLQLLAAPALDGEPPC